MTHSAISAGRPVPAAAERPVADALAPLTTLAQG
jgi:hypothetical protein